MSTHEIFGPVISVYEKKSMDDAILQANSLPFAFKHRYFQTTMPKLWRGLIGSTVCIMVNDHSAFRVDWMPFAGRKSSGLGVGGIPYYRGNVPVQDGCAFVQ